MEAEAPLQAMVTYLSNGAMPRSAMPTVSASGAATLPITPTPTNMRARDSSGDLGRVDGRVERRKIWPRQALKAASSSHCLRASLSRARQWWWWW